MDIVIDVVKQDLSAALKALDEDNFRFVTIMGNRVTSNLLIGERKDLMVFGYLLREVGHEFEAIKRRDEKRIGECKEIGIEFLKGLRSIIIKESILSKEIWELYYEYENNIIKYIPDKIELSVYTSAPEFTEKATSMLVKHLDTNKDILVRENNQLIQGLLNELTRVINVHGLKRRDIVFYLLLQALSGYYEYLLYSETKAYTATIENKEEFKNKIYPYVDKIVDLISNFDTNSIEEMYNKTNEILGELCSEWRKFFLNYLDIIKTKIVYPERREEIIPEEARKKIGETIAKALEEEAKK